MTAERIEKDPNASADITLQEAKAFCEWMSELTGREVKLPSLAHLKKAYEEDEVVSTGPEWTSEGYIYDHLTNTLLKDPPEDITAHFRPMTEAPRIKIRRKRKRH